MVYDVYAIYMDSYELSQGFYVFVPIYSEERSEHIKKSGQ